MTNSWVPPMRNQYKINVHTYSTSRQSNEYNNGVGIVIRDHRGRLVKGLCGTIPDMPFLATQLWALNMGLNHARKEQPEFIALETDNHHAYCEVMRKDGRGDRSMFWIVEQIKKLLAYNEGQDSFRGRICKQGGLLFGSCWVKVMYHFYEPFDRLQERMDLDMGYGLHFSQLRSVAILGISSPHFDRAWAAFS